MAARQPPKKAAKPAPQVESTSELPKAKPATRTKAKRGKEHHDPHRHVAPQVEARYRRFAAEYLIDHNATQAAKRAGYAEGSAHSQGHFLLSDPKVQLFILEERQKLAERTEITQEVVLKRLFDIATADPRELVEHVTICCRHCYGVEHNYQWKNLREFNAAMAEWKRVEGNTPVKKRAYLPDPPEDSGGYGWDPRIAPSQDCPECFGFGRTETRFKDTRTLSAAGLAIYEGMEETREGKKMKIADRGAALVNVGRVLGMFNDKLKLLGDKEDPLTVVVREIQGGSLGVNASPVEDSEDD